MVLEYIDDPDVPRSGTIKYDEDDNSIEMIEEDTPLSSIDKEDKILPKTGQSSDESRKIAVFVLMLLAIYLRRKNKNI